MNDKTNDIIYTAQDIEHYLSGKLTPLQMHMMEKAALDDPFLAEAMEGYAGMNEKQWKNQLIDLKNKFENKEGAKVIPLGKRKNNWWKVAAAVILIGGISTIAYFLVNKKEPVQIAGTVPAAKEQPRADSNTAIATQPGSAETATVTPQVKSGTTEKNNTTLSAGENTVATKETKVSDSLFVYTPGRQKAKTEAKQNAESVRADGDELEKLASNDIKPATATAPAVSYNNTNLERKAEENKALLNNSYNGVISQPQYDKLKAIPDKAGYSALKKEVQLNRNFIAQVVGPDNSPLPFANISIKSENFGTYADAKGNFRLVSSDSVITVEVKAAGYQPKFYTLQSYAQQNKIMLAQDDEAFKYKAISGNGSVVKNRASRRATLVKDSLVNVEPADGWDNYNTYVDNNLDIPEDILNKNIHGRVELSFDVRSNGTITNIKVDKSLCDNCDEVAKRLIEQGPQWKVKKGKKGKGKVTVEF